MRHLGETPAEWEARRVASLSMLESIRALARSQAPSPPPPSSARRTM
jgi:hypothetical protein